MVGSKYHGLTNSYMTDAERASLDPESEEYEFRQMGSRIQVVGWSLYALELWLLKACLAFFYSRLTYVDAAPLPGAVAAAPFPTPGG